MARSISPRDTLIHRFLPLADGLAWRFHTRFRDLLEADDLIQVARLALVQASGRIRRERTAPAYLKCCITGALRHHLRDRALLVRLPSRARSTAPWRHLSLDQPILAAANADGDRGCQLDALLASSQRSPEPPEPAADAAQLLAGLEPPLAAAVRLTVLDGLSLGQAAARLGISAMTVSRRRRAGLQQLHQLLHLKPANAATSSR